MKLAQQTQYKMPPQAVIDDLLARGALPEDIEIGITMQERQRDAGAPVLPLAVLVGLEQPSREPQSVLNRVARTILRMKPPARRKAITRHITGNPVWAGSVQTGGDEERNFVRSISKKEQKALQAASYRILEKARVLTRAARNGVELTADEELLSKFNTSCHEIWLKILDEIQFRKGWCIPRYETIMQWTALSRGTIHNTLKILRSIGLIDWTRRFHYTKSPEFGARSEQTSNLYRAGLPKWLARMLGMEIPVPDDVLTQQEAELEDHALMLASASKTERRFLMPTKPEAQAALLNAANRLENCGDHSAAREFSHWIAPHLNNIFNKKERSELPIKGNRLARFRV